MRKEQFVGKSKREVLAMLPADVKIAYFETRKGIPQMLSLVGKDWCLLLFFDKTTRRVIEH